MERDFVIEVLDECSEVLQDYEGKMTETIKAQLAVVYEQVNSLLDLLDEEV